MERRNPKLVDFDQLYPGRFIKGGELLDKKVPLTIADVDVEELIGSDGKAQQKATVIFNETPKALVLCKTNGLCIKAMFGKTLDNWIEKGIVLFKGNWNGEDCVRIWGSWNIEKDMDVEIQLPRRKPFKMLMHKMSPPRSAQREPGQEG